MQFIWVRNVMGNALLLIALSWQTTWIKSSFLCLLRCGRLADRNDIIFQTWFLATFSYKLHSQYKIKKKRDALVYLYKIGIAHVEDWSQTPTGFDLHPILWLRKTRNITFRSGEHIQGARHYMCLLLGMEILKYESPVLINLFNA
jgi:hypothetical protein